MVRNRRTNKNAGVSSKEKLSSSLGLKTQGEGTELPKCDEGWSNCAQWLFPGKCRTICSSGRKKKCLLVIFANFPEENPPIIQISSYHCEVSAHGVGKG